VVLAPGRLAGKVAVVNGAASEIGGAVARRFADEGASVVGVDRVEHSVGDTSMVVDLLDEDLVERLYADVVRAHGHLDVIYNNAGVMDVGDRAVMDTSLETWHRVVDGNLTAVFLSCKHGIPHVRDTQPAGGSVVNATSFLGTMGSATAQMAFSAAKAAVDQLTRDLGVHLARSGVRVNAVQFGPIETTPQRAVLESNPEVLQKRMVHWPSGRYGSLDEAAATVAFLASDDAGFITATSVPLDGGINRAFTVPE
jgi:NAD(P)-dependent dehydrogenase (short-subunit alcohol dehydrogenase family)